MPIDRGEPGPECPGWCRREHSGSDLAEDRVHQSEPILLGAVVHRAPLFLGRGAAEATEVLVQVQGRVGEQAWVCIREAEKAGSLPLLSLVSAHSLAVALMDLLAQVA